MRAGKLFKVSQQTQNQEKGMCSDSRTAESSLPTCSPKLTSTASHSSFLGIWVKEEVGEGRRMIVVEVRKVKILSTRNFSLTQTGLPKALTQ